ncbi:Purine permease 1 [Linum perenne]
MEMQLIISLFATLFNFFGMIVFSSELQVRIQYGILIATFLPVTEILAVFIYNEKFGAEKAVALILSIWGFVSYFYGEYKQMTKKRDPTRTPPLG